MSTEQEEKGRSFIWAQKGAPVTMVPKGESNRYTLNFGMPVEGEVKQAFERLDDYFQQQSTKKEKLFGRRSDAYQYVAMINKPTHNREELTRRLRQKIQDKKKARGL